MWCRWDLGQCFDLSLELDDYMGIMTEKRDFKSRYWVLAHDSSKYQMFAVNFYFKKKIKKIIELFLALTLFFITLNLDWDWI